MSEDTHDTFQALLNQLSRQAMDAGTPGAEARKKLQELLGLDDLNVAYFLGLLKKRLYSHMAEPLLLNDPEHPEFSSGNAYSTAVAPEEIRALLPCVEYDSLVSSPKHYTRAAERVVLWVKKMHAGTGTSMRRVAYLSAQRGIKESEVRIGAKGTDLLVEVPRLGDPLKRVPISLVEAQILQLILDVERGEFSGAVFHDIVSSETEASVHEVWSKPSYRDPRKTYRELVDSNPSLGRSGATFQALIPTIDQNGELTCRRRAPGGHALFAIDNLRCACRDADRPPAEGCSLISAIGNGEDLSSTPDRFILGWMREENIPIAMVTTDKTEVDFHGGQIVLVHRPDGSFHVTIFEQAQAKLAGQSQLFEQLGLRPGDRKALFNTNLALFNFEVLSPKIRQLVKEVGEERFMEAILPDLIQNKKEQVDEDGVSRPYVQLEGAMGSTLLNFDRFWRSRYGEPLVHFVNVDRKSRTRFFSPLKSPFDFFMQFHSDLFTFDPKTMRVVSQRPGHLPAYAFKGPPDQPGYYGDLQVVLDAFRGTAVSLLDDLRVEGAVLLNDAVLKGQVVIANDRDHKADVSRLLTDQGLVALDQGRPCLANVEVILRRAKKPEVRKLTP